MQHSELVQKLTKPGQDIIDTLTPSKINLLHMAVGISGEVAELCDAPDEDRVNQVEELGDIEFYLNGLCAELDYTPRPAVIDKFEGIHLVTTAGNLLDTVKKVVIYNQPCVEPIERAIDAFGAALSEVYTMLNIDRDEAINGNIAKLTKRYGESYSDEAAEKRADKEGEDNA